MAHLLIIITTMIMLHSLGDLSLRTLRSRDSVSDLAGCVFCVYLVHQPRFEPNSLAWNTRENRSRRVFSHQTTCVVHTHKNCNAPGTWYCRTQTTNFISRWLEGYPVITEKFDLIPTLPIKAAMTHIPEDLFNFDKLKKSNSKVRS